MKYKISDIASTGSGSTPNSQRQEYYLGGNIPWINSGELAEPFIYRTDNFITQLGYDSCSVKIFPIDTVLVAMYGATAGKTSLLKIPATTNQAICAIIPDKTKVDPYYLKYKLDTMYDYLVNLSTGSARNNLSQIGIRQLEVDLPDLSTQKRIASVLSNIDRKIALNRAMNEELEQTARDLYDYWFLQFDFPDANGKPYRSSGGKMVYNPQLKREIPQGWEVGNICKVADILSGGTPSKSQPQFWNGNILFFGPTDYKNQMFQLNTKDRITEVGLNKCASSLYEEGVIIITARGSIGKLVICGRPMAMNQSCYALRSLKGEYQYLYFLSQDLIKYLKVKGSGSTFDSIISSDIKASYFPIPYPNLITEFCKIVAPWFGHIKNNSMEIDHLTSLRDELLPLLMNGQVKVKE